MTKSEKRLKGVVCAHVARSKSSSLEEALQMSLAKWKGLVSPSLVTEWVTTSWNLQSSRRRFKETQSASEITLIELKTAANLQFLINRLGVEATDLESMIAAIESLGGVTRAYQVMAELQALKGDNFSLPGF